MKNQAISAPITFENILVFIIDVIGGEFERGNIVKEDCVVSAATDEICTQEPNNPVHEAVERNNSEDPRLIERAKVVGVQYEFAQDGVVETEPDRVKRCHRNQRNIVGEERRLREAIGYLPPPPPMGLSEVEDKAYCAIHAFEVEQLTYSFSCCDICKERRLECKGFGNMCTHKTLFR